MKKFGKLIDGELIFAPDIIEYDNMQYITCDPLIYNQVGWKEIIYTQKPSSINGSYIFSWTENDQNIIQTWNFFPYTEEEKRKKYESEVNNNIRIKYDINTEFSILRKYLMYGEQYKEDFQKYNEYVEQSKEKAYEIVYGVSK